MIFFLSLAAPVADFQKFRHEMDREIHHIETELDKLFAHAHHAERTHEGTQHIIQETMKLEAHLHHLDVKLQAELKLKLGDVAHYYIERKLEEVRVLFRQAADIFFKIGHHRENHHEHHGGHHGHHEEHKGHHEGHEGNHGHN